jgi:hypothetical protein
MIIQYLLDSTYVVLKYTNTVIHTKGKKQCNRGKEMRAGESLQQGNSFQFKRREGYIHVIFE